MVIDGKTITGWCTYSDIANPLGEEAQDRPGYVPGEIYIDGTALEIGPDTTANPPITPPS